MALAQQTCNPSSADWQSAVSRIGNPLVFENLTFCRLPVGGYGRFLAAGTELAARPFLQRLVEPVEFLILICFALSPTPFC
jgi:hypothetical protein